MRPAPDCVDDLDEPRDIAKVLKVSVRTVQRLAQRGKIPHYQVGDQLRFDRAEVLAATRREVAA